MKKEEKRGKFTSNNDRCKLQEIVHLLAVIGHKELIISSTKKSVLATWKIDLSNPLCRKKKKNTRDVLPSILSGHSTMPSTTSSAYRQPLPFPIGNHNSNTHMGFNL